MRRRRAHLPGCGSSGAFRSCPRAPRLHAGEADGTAMPIFGEPSREQMRRMYVQAWRKFTTQAPLQPLEAQIAAVIAEHPEYHPWLEGGDAALGAEFTPESGRQNPFLH